MTVQTVLIDSIVIPEIRSNAIYTAEQYQNIKQSIAASGIQFRPLCRYLPDGKLELVDGLHRMKAWHELGHTDIEVEIEVLDDMQAMTKHLTANHHRGEADPIGLAKVVKKMHDAGKSYDDIGKVLGYSGSTVSKYETLLTLPTFVQDALTNQQIKIGHVQQFARLEDINDIQAAMNFSIQMKWTVEVLKYWVDARLAERQQAYQTPGIVPGEMINPPAPSADLAQHRQCLCCGSYGEAQTMWYPLLCKGCHDALEYLKTVDKQPWNAILAVSQSLEEMQRQIADRDAKLKELSEKFIDLSLRLQPGGGEPTPVWPKPASTGSGGPQQPQV